MKRTHRTRSLAVAAAAAAALTVGACSGESAYDEDPIENETEDTVTVDGTGVDQGQQDGLDLDNGNVPGSQNDQDLDPVDEENGLNG